MVFLNERTWKLYTGKILTREEEMQLIKEKISELQLSIDVATIEINASKDCIKHFEDRLRTIEAVT